MINQLTIVGYVGKNAETKDLANGTPVVKFSVATRKAWKDEQGEWKDRTPRPRPQRQLSERRGRANPRRRGALLGPLFMPSHGLRSTLPQVFSASPPSCLRNPSPTRPSGLSTSFAVQKRRSSTRDSARADGIAYRSPKDVSGVGRGADRNGLLELACGLTKVKAASLVSISAYLHIAPKAGVVLASIQEKPLTGCTGAFSD